MAASGEQLTAGPAEIAGDVQLSITVAPRGFGAAFAAMEHPTDPQLGATVR